MTEPVLAVFAFVLGAIVGSFLNVCIYRLPRGLSVNEPRRSFCPHCEKMIPWHQNIPIVSWLLLRGRCASCGNGIPFRYLAIELLTGGAFLGIWLASPFPESFAYWIFASLLIVATFVDFDFMIIPDEVTLGGAAVGIVLSAALPALHEAGSHLSGLLESAIGAAAGFALLFLVVEGGKKAFGRKKVRFDKAVPFAIEQGKEQPQVRIGDDLFLWEDLFYRKGDRLEILGSQMEGDFSAEEPAALHVWHDHARCGDREMPLEAMQGVRGMTRQVEIPREAMGFGDVKFMACIGAFCGWKGALFSVMAASVIGTFVGVACLLGPKQLAGVRIPFGPYLALGSVIWLVCGNWLVGWYFGLLR